MQPPKIEQSDNGGRQAAAADRGDGAETIEQARGKALAANASEMKQPSALKKSAQMALARIGKRYPFTSLHWFFCFTITAFWFFSLITGNIPQTLPLAVPALVISALWLLPALMYWPEAISTARLMRTSTQQSNTAAEWPDAAGIAPTLPRAFWLLFLLSAILALLLGYSFGFSNMALPFALSACVILLPSPVLPSVNAALRSGAEKLLQQNIVLRRGGALLDAARIDLLLLDKTGTLTLGQRTAISFLPQAGFTAAAMAEAAALSSLQDETPEGRSITKLAREKFGVVPTLPSAAFAIPFSEETRLSGLDLPTEKIRKGAASAMLLWLGKTADAALAAEIQAMAETGDTPLLLGRASAGEKQIIGIIRLRDKIKPGIKLKIALLSRLGIRSMMLTGDHPAVAAAMAKQTGLDEYLAEATPESKRALIAEQRRKGRYVAMFGDGTNDVPALRASNLSLVPASAAPEALAVADMVDGSGSPSRLMDIVLLGRQVVAARMACRLFQRGADAARLPLVGALILGFAEAGWSENLMQGAPEAAAMVLAGLLVKAAPLLVTLRLSLAGVRVGRRRVPRHWWQWPWHYAALGASLSMLVLLIIERLLLGLFSL